MVNSLIKNTVDTIGPKSLHSWMGAKQKPIILDAREKKEFKVSCLPGAQNIGYDRLDKELLKGLSKEDTIVVYCTVGYRSEKVGEYLKKRGFKHVYNL